MKKIHSYAADPRERLKIWGYIAVTSYILTLIPPFLATWLVDFPVAGVIASIPIPVWEPSDSLSAAMSIGSALPVVLVDAVGC